MNVKFVRFNSKRYGGNILREHIKKAISTVAECEFFTLTETGGSFRGKLQALKNLFRVEKGSEPEIIIRDYWSALTKSKRSASPNILNIFHIDNSVVAHRWIHRFLEKRVYRHLKNFDVVTVMSKYWQEYFVALGHPDVRLMYLGYDLSIYNRSEADVKEFKKKYGLDGKPVVYIGNAQKAKGAAEVYEELKDLDVILLTSGRKEVDIPVRNLDLSFSEYITFLKAADIVITMSLFNEGWCMVAHEAMLMKTPVIGSGRGGMRELLEGGGQIVCEDFSRLKVQVEELLDSPARMREMGEQGRAYGTTFTMEKLTKSWTDLIDSMQRKHE